MHNNNYGTANTAWLSNIRDVSTCGSEISPRGINTLEILDQSCVFDMNYPICYSPSRKLSYKFMAAEAYWITSGSMFVEDIAPYNKHIQKFSDDNHIFNGNYGVPFIHQLQSVINALVDDRDSRQAVMTIWRPNPIKTKDYPCTISLMFSIRDNKINTKVVMRSQDLFLGQPYDFFNFTMMTLRVLSGINAKVEDMMSLGNMYWSGFSTHIYENNLEACRTILQEPIQNTTSKVPEEAMYDWNFVANSLIACRDMVSTEGLWQIRPEVQ